MLKSVIGQAFHSLAFLGSSSVKPSVCGQGRNLPPRIIYSYSVFIIQYNKFFCNKLFPEMNIFFNTSLIKILPVQAKIHQNPTESKLFLIICEKNDKVIFNILKKN